MSIYLKCPICGGTSFIEGRISGGHVVHFIPKGFSLWSKNERIEARACERCGNIQMFMPVGEPEPLPDI